MLIKEVPRIRPNTKNLVKYILNKATRIGGNIPVSMGNINESAKCIELDFNRRLTAKQKTNEMHYIVSFEEQHKDISDDRLLLIGNELIKRHFGDNRNFLLAVHRDTANPHLHMLMESRDFDNKPFYKLDNYRSLENMAQKLEIKFKLKNEKISESRNDSTITRLNYKAKQYENRTGQTSDEKKYKQELKEILGSAKTPVVLFEAMKEQGFTIRANKSKTGPLKLSGYYITKGSTSVKPSSIGLQISKLVEKYKIDENGVAELILRYESPLPPDELGEIATNPEPDLKPQTNRRESLYTKFQTSDGITYTSKNERYKASFTVLPNSVSFTNPNEMSIKAGFQALLEQGSKGPFYLTGSEDFKRKTWLVSAMMGLEVSNYQPTQSDLSALFKRVKANQEKYPRVKVNILETQLHALKKESYEVDELIKSAIPFSELFPGHSTPQTVQKKQDRTHPSEEIETKKSNSVKKSSAEKIFDSQELDSKLLEKLSRQKEIGLEPRQPLKVHKP
ncbi:relaxase/mobilization nuclease domain-containing protein [Pseudomonas agarici]|uniref:relaxase/mobilization nuclease domain-containing protein n=1 Tax=Pseudomonas agarici TaxID=46677 RepID=UPI0015A2724E|nr:relaxase/mobilization nuclease domain-containing protein [Pseudomonas agarici]NWB90236.1 relaxase/mobilization nuclease domain-containing protein [Pseudomonas agarici]